MVRLTHGTFRRPLRSVQTNITNDVLTFYRPVEMLVKIQEVFCCDVGIYTARVAIESDVSAISPQSNTRHINATFISSESLTAEECSERD